MLSGKLKNHGLSIKIIKHLNLTLLIFFLKDILEIKYIYNGKNKTQYKYTYDSLYCINNFKFLDFLVGVEEVPVEEIEQIKLSRKLNKF